MCLPIGMLKCYSALGAVLTLVAGLVLLGGIPTLIQFPSTASPSRKSGFKTPMATRIS